MSETDWQLGVLIAFFVTIVFVVCHEVVMVKREQRDRRRRRLEEQRMQERVLLDQYRKMNLETEKDKE